MHRYLTTQHLNNLASYHKPDRIIILGDTLHSGGEVNLSLIEAMELYNYKELSDFAPLDILVGNHDYSADGDVLLETIFDDASVLRTPEVREYDESLLVYYPASKEGAGTALQEKEKMEAYLETLRGKYSKKQVYIFFHHDVLEWYSTLHHIKKGLPWKAIKSKVVDVLDPVSVIGIDGHLHSYLLGEGLLVLGVPVRSNFKTTIPLVPFGPPLKTERGGFCLIDTSTTEIEVFSNPYSPSFVTLDARQYEFGAWAIDRLKAFREELKGMLFFEILIDHNTSCDIPRDVLDEITDGFRVRTRKQKKEEDEREVAQKSFSDLSWKELIEFVKNKVINSASSGQAKQAAESLFASTEITKMVEELKDEEPDEIN